MKLQISVEVFLADKPLAHQTISLQSDDISPKTVADLADAAGDMAADQLRKHYEQKQPKQALTK